MNEVEKVIDLCKQNKIPISAVEKACGFSNGYIVRLRKGFFPPDRREKLIEYFGKDIFEDNSSESSSIMSESQQIMIAYQNADDQTKEIVRRLLAYDKYVKGR